MTNADVDPARLTALRQGSRDAAFRAFTLSDYPMALIHWGDALTYERALWGTSDPTDLMSMRCCSKLMDRAAWAQFARLVAARKLRGAEHAEAQS